MKKKVGVITAILFLMIGVILLLFPYYTKKENGKVQNGLLEQYENLIAANKEKTSKKLPTPEPQKDNMDYTIADFVEDNTSKDTKSIIDRQQIIGKITCDKIGIEYIVVEGADRDNIRATIGHIKGTAGFGGKGNCVLAGHRGGYYGKFFKEIDQLTKGDVVVVTDLYNRNYYYEVYEQQVVEPDALWICEPVEGKKILTLLSCEDHGTKRRIVRCQLKNSIDRLEN